MNTSIAPWLSVRNSHAALAFYRTAFGALEVFRLEAPDGALVARLSIQGAEFWLSNESSENGNYSPETLGGGTVRMILTVNDPDSMFAMALKAGAREVSPVSEEHGWRSGRLADPFGHHWEIGQPL
jgi:PhnB protein